MVHDAHNRRVSSGMFMILIGCFLFIVGPLYLSETPGLGAAAIVGGFVIGGLGFLVRYRTARRDAARGGGGVEGGGPHRPG